MLKKISDSLLCSIFVALILFATVGQIVIDMIGTFRK